MPTYDYRCNSCDHAFEAFQMMSAKPLTTCPECNTDALERLIGTGAGLIFKGSGFYETDYRSDSYKKAAEKDKKPAPDGKADGSKDKKASGGTSEGSKGGGVKPSGKASESSPTAANPKKSSGT